jgi:hypothetical protein
VEAVLRTLAQAGDHRSSGLLFHATCEEFDLPDVRPSDYDGVFWTSDCPAISQSYVPKAGISSYISLPMSYEMDQHVRPSRHSIWTTLAAQRTGLTVDDCDPTFDHMGHATSWRIPQGWPRMREMVEALKEMGYDTSRDSFEVLMRGDEIMPADWRLSGRLLVLDGHGLRLKDLRRGSEGDLTDVEYHDLPAFRQAEAEGWDGVVINDFAQTDEGNMGHVSYGLFASTLARLEPVVVPCLRSTWDEIMAARSGDLDAWVNALDATPEPSPAPMPRP